jgi:hypothetical protein
MCFWAENQENRVFLDEKIRKLCLFGREPNGNNVSLSRRKEETIPEVSFWMGNQKKNSEIKSSKN